MPGAAALDIDLPTHSGCCGPIKCDKGAPHIAQIDLVLDVEVKAVQVLVESECRQFPRRWGSTDLIEYEQQQAGWTAQQASHCAHNCVHTRADIMRSGLNGSTRCGGGCLADSLLGLGYGQGAGALKQNAELAGLCRAARKRSNARHESCLPARLL
jgi:hypothetical protein